MRREVVTHIEETTDTVLKALKEAELMAGASIDRVYAGIAGEHIRSRTSHGVVAVRGEDIGVSDVQGVHAVAQAVAFPPDRELLHAIPLEYAVDDQKGIRDPIGMAGVRLETEVYLVTCSSPEAANIRKAVSRAGYRLQELVLESLASARAVLTEDEKEVGVAMVELGGSTTDLVVYYDGDIRHSATLPIGGVTITSDLAKGLSIPFADAQRAKEVHGAAFSPLRRPSGNRGDPRSEPRPEEARREGDHRAHRRAAPRRNAGDGSGGAQAEGVPRQPRSRDRDHRRGRRALGDPRVGATGLRFAGSPGRAGEGLTGLADAVARPAFTTATGLVLYGADRYVQTGEGASTLTSGFFGKLGAWFREFF